MGNDSGVPLWERGIAMSVLLLLSPLLLLLILWVKVVSPGPGLFLSDRIGKDGSIFRLFKLRTMVPNSPQVLSDDLLTVVENNDARLICGGKILRKGFDELFQLINVAKGEMRFVGPRPDMVWMKDYYLPDVLPRISIPPGITGWAQILGSRNMSTRQGYLLDLWYIDHRNCLLDVGIFLWTPLYVFFGLTLPEQIRDRCFNEMAGTGPTYSGEKKRGSVI